MTSQSSQLQLGCCFLYLARYVFSAAWALRQSQFCPCSLGAVSVSSLNHIISSNDQWIHQPISQSVNDIQPMIVSRFGFGLSGSRHKLLRFVSSGEISPFLQFIQPAGFACNPAVNHNPCAQGTLVHSRCSCPFASSVFLSYTTACNHLYQLHYNFQLSLPALPQLPVSVPMLS